MKTALLMLFVSSLAMPAGVQAAFVSYGDSPDVSPGFKFLGVTESSGTDPVPLYGPPSYVPGGMHFKPLGFATSATGGAADIIDGQLNFTLAGNVVGTQIGVINSINVRESGDYTLAGPGTLNTLVNVAPALHFAVTQIDGVDVSPILILTSELGHPVSRSGRRAAAVPRPFEGEPGEPWGRRAA